MEHCDPTTRFRGSHHGGRRLHGDQRLRERVREPSAQPECEFEQSGQHRRDDRQSVTDRYLIELGDTVGGDEADPETDSSADRQTDRYTDPHADPDIDPVAIVGIDQAVIDIVGHVVDIE